MRFYLGEKVKSSGSLLGRPVFFALLSLFVFVVTFSFGKAVPSVPSAIPEQGYWLVESKDGIFYLAPCESSHKTHETRLCGWLVGLDYTEAKPPVDYWGRSQCGLTMMQDLKRDEDGAWQGKILDPRSGRQYGASVKLGKDGLLRLHGYVILPLFGQTQVWTRYKGPPIGPQCRMVMKR